MPESRPSPARELSLRVAAIQLLIASFVVLFQELALIRWLPGQVRVIAYFPNLVLISAFLGLGIGCLRARSRSLLWLWPISLAALAAMAAALSRIAFTQESESEHLWLLYHDLGPDALLINGVRLPIVVLFVASAVTFVPLGQLVAQLLRVFQERSVSLWGYSWDLSGSLLGVLLFAVVSLLATPPIVWFTVVVGLGAFLVLWRSPSRSMWPYVIGLGTVVLGIVYGFQGADRYSPYYAIDYEVEHGVLEITTNGSLHQIGMPLRNEDPDPPTATRTGYHIPYTKLARAPRRVLVLGAGSGNDVAVALDEGAEHVDAVEIDPVIIELGREHHPNRPYSSERVRVLNTDARSFLNDTEETYDLIVFGTLDSMTRLSALSNVRLDNYVYTQECLEAARKRLSDDGGVALYFMVKSDHIHRKLLGMLTEVFGELPQVVDRNFVMFNRLFMTGPAFAASAPVAVAAATADFRRTTLPGIDLPNDDWPYLYLRSRGVSSFYLSLMAVFLVIAVAGVALASPDFRRSLTGGGADWEMMLYGVAFLLIETKFITEMSLVWGATWITTAVVFGSVLFMVLASTVVMQLRSMTWRWATLGLIVSLLVNYWVPTQVLIGRELPIKLALSVLFVGAPIFFAAACFALRFRCRVAVDLAFGWNLLGAVLGGLLEFTAMAVGIKALTLLGLAAYLGAFLLATRYPAASESAG